MWPFHSNKVNPSQECIDSLIRWNSYLSQRIIDLEKELATVRGECCSCRSTRIGDMCARVAKRVVMKMSNTRKKPSE